MMTIRDLRAKRGLTQAELARLVGTSQPQIKRLESGERSLTKQWAKRIAQHLGVSAESLLFEHEERDDSEREVAGLPVAGTSRAGDWLDITMIDEVEPDFIPVARHPQFMRARQYALLVSGDSMDLLFRDGSYVTCVDFAESGLSLKPGMILHIRRTLAGRQLVETTIKKLGDRVLLPQSSNPVHKPIALNGDEDTEITVAGVVIGKWEPIAFEGFLS